MNRLSEESRVRWVDFIRALSAFLVVLAHIQYKGAGPAWAGWFYYSLSRVAVPLFFMVPGYLLLSKTESVSAFFQRRLVRVFVPFLLWSVIYLVWKQEGFGNPFMELMKSYLVRILRGPRENHLWFFYELFGLYLFTPILRIYTSRASRSDLMYFCGLWFLMIPVGNLIQEFTPIKIGFSYQFLGGYIGYFIYGYFAGGMEFTRRQKSFAIAIFVLCWGLTMLGMYFRSIHNLKSQYFEDYQSINVVMMAASLFVCFSKAPISDQIKRVVLPLSRASFGIYLVHVIVVAEVFSNPQLGAVSSSGSAIYMIPFMGVLGFVLSFLLIQILRAIPILRILAP
ncbi:MAG: hypothetical protein FJZ87_01260 [Chloroflexi bacterium]|nr:hypothetical protein [Chloroflexota bacterium]